MSKVNYGMPLRDTGLPEGMINYITKDLGPLEKAAIINTLLGDLISSDCKFIDGDNPGDDFLSELTYDPDTDNLIFWTENL
jgi:hypothetical protein